MDQFQIFDPNDVRAAVVDENGGLNFIAGSIPPEEEDGSEVGFNFSRTPFKGHEPRMEEPGMYYDPANMEGAEYLWMTRSSVSNLLKTQNMLDL